jgi:hypothetical protein
MIGLSNLSIGIGRRRHGGGGGVSGMKIGQNISFYVYYNYQHLTVDIAHGEGVYQVGNAGAGVPYANFGADNNVNSLPAGATAFQMFFHPPVASEQYKLEWDNNYDGTITLNGATGVGAPTATSITFTPRDIVQAISANAGTYATFTPPVSGSWPSNFRCRPVADPGGTVPALTKSKFLALSSGGPIRFTHPSSVEQNLHVNSSFDHTGTGGIKFPQDGDGQLQEELLTATKRNTTAAVQWYFRRDGMPIETQLAICTELGRDYWRNEHWNTDGTNSNGTTYTSTYLTEMARQCAAFSLATGRKTFVEASNEIWNTGTYSAARQCFNEAQALGIAFEERYAQKALQIFSYYEAAFAAVGVSDKLVRVFAWQNQNSGTPASFQTMLAFTGVTGHVDALSTAWYYNCDQVTYPATYTGATAPVIASMFAGIDSTLDYAVAAKAVADAHGLLFLGYEGGRSDSFNDATFLASLDVDSGGYNVQAYWGNETRRRLGPNCVDNYFNFNEKLTIAGLGGNFGLQNTISDTLSALPKAHAIADAILGNFTMFDPSLDNLSVNANTPANTSIGKFGKGLLPEATLTMTDANGYFTVDSSGNLKTVGSSRPQNTSPGYSVTLHQTYNGTTKDTVFTIPVNAALNNTHAYRYYRITISAVQQFFDPEIAEVEIAAAPGGADTTTSVTATADSFNPSHPPAYLIDNTTANTWLVGTGYSMPMHVMFDYGATSANWIAANQLKITAPGQAGNAPKNFTFDGSDDGSSWTTLITQTNQTFTAGQTLTYTV